MLEFAINGQDYRAGKLNAFQQLHLSRKIAPLLPKLLTAYAGMHRFEDGSIDTVVFGTAIGPLAEALAGMSEADCEYVIGVSLSVVSRKQGAAWAAVWNAASKSPMFDDIDLAVMIEIVAKVVSDSLGPFIRGLLARAPAASPVTQ